MNLFLKNLTRLIGDRRPAWLAKASGLQQSTIGRILDGKMKPSFDTIAPLAHGLGVHPVEFFIDEGSSYTRPVALDPDQLEAIRQALSGPVAPRIPRDIMNALEAYQGDWNLLRALLDIPEVHVGAAKKKAR